MTFSRASALCLAGVLTCAASPVAQTDAQKSSQSSAATAILVDVVVRDKEGEPVTDLKPEEFEIVEDGVTQALGGFTPIFRDGGGSPSAPAPTQPLQSGAIAAAAAPSAAPNAPPQASPEALAIPTEVLALVFDRLTPDGRNLAYRAALSYIEGNTRADRVVGVYGLDLSLIPYQGFTRDLGAVRKSLDQFANRATSQFTGSRAEREQLSTRVAAAGLAANAAEQSAAGGGPGAGAAAGGMAGTQGEAAMVQMQARLLETFETLERDQVGYSTANGLMAVVSSMRSMPGRKAVIFFSEGLSIPPNVQERFYAVIAAANRANVSIYSMDAAGLRTDSPLKQTGDELMMASREALRRNPSRDVTGAPMTQALERNEDRLRMDPQSGLTTLAEQTGGMLVANTNDFRRGLSRVDSDMRNYYMLSYQPSNEEFDGRYRQISIRVTRPNVSVQHRKGYYAVRAPAGAPVLSYEAPVLAMLEKTPVPNAFPLRAIAMRFPEASRPGLTPIVVELPTAGITFERAKEQNVYRSDFTILVRLRSQDGEALEKMSQRYELQGPLDQIDRAKVGEVIFYREANLAPGVYTMETIVYDALSKKASVRFSTVEKPNIDTDRMRLSNLLIVRRGEKIAEAERIPGSPLYVGDTLLYPNLGTPLKAGVDKELPFYFTVYLGTGAADLAASLEVLQNAKPLARVPLQLAAPDAERKIQQVSRIPIEQLTPGSYELRVTVRQGTTGLTQSASFRIVG